MAIADTDPRQPSARYTIAELSERSGVSVRTIRFYQTKGALPPPVRKGRQAFYSDEHSAMLDTIVSLRDRGEKLERIIEYLRTSGDRYEEVYSLVGVRERIEAAWAPESPTLWTRAEINEFVGYDRPGLMGDLEEKETIVRQGFGFPNLYLVPSPTLLRIGARLMQLGLGVDGVHAMHEMLGQAMTQAADGLVRLIATQVLEDGVGDPTMFADMAAELRGLASEAVVTIFVQKTAGVIHELLNDDETVVAFIRAVRGDEDVDAEVLNGPTEADEPPAGSPA